MIYCFDKDGKLECVKNSWGTYDYIELADGTSAEIEPNFNKEEFKAKHKIVVDPSIQCMSFDQIVDAIKEGYRPDRKLLTFDDLKHIAKEDEMFTFSEFKGFPKTEIPWEL